MTTDENGLADFNDALRDYILSQKDAYKTGLAQLFPTIPFMAPIIFFSTKYRSMYQYGKIALDVANLITVSDQKKWDEGIKKHESWIKSETESLQALVNLIKALRDLTPEIIINNPKYNKMLAAVELIRDPLKTAMVNERLVELEEKISRKKSPNTAKIVPDPRRS